MQGLRKEVGMTDCYPIPEFLRCQPEQPAGRRERPILFSAPMISALLDGTKTQTRRVMKPQPGGHIWTDSKTGLLMTDIKHKFGPSTALICPYGQPGDRLWVRESWRQAYPPTSFSNGIIFRADAFRACGMDEYSDRHQWKPSIHMRRADSRILLEIVGVRVERLQDISEADAIAEGVIEGDGDFAGCFSVPGTQAMSGTTAKECYARLWDQINGGGAWAVNPWVWCLTFNRVTP